MTTARPGANGAASPGGLDWITVRGFRSIRHLEKWKLGRVNVLIGANGSGKSNFLDVFNLLAAIRQGRLRTFVLRAGGADRLLHFGSKTTDRIVLRLSFLEERNQYRIVLGHVVGGALAPTDETALFWNKEKHNQPYAKRLEGSRLEAGISNFPGADASFSVPGYVAERLAGLRKYHFHDTGDKSPLRGLADTHDNRFLRADGSNLPSFLHRLRITHPTRYDLIRRTVRLVAPFFRDFCLAPMAVNEEKIRLEWQHSVSDATFAAASLSDGTLRFMALAAVLLQPEKMRPAVILLDEPEIGLHPTAIGLLAALVRQASVDSQVILATQSPTLLDYFDPEDVMIVERKNGETVFRRKTSKELSVWLEDYSLGQLWENNEMGGRLVSERQR